MLERFLYDGEKELGGCVGTINQRRIRYKISKDLNESIEIFTLKYWFEKN